MFLFLKMINSKNNLSVKTKLFLLIILITAAFFRFYNLNWDEGHFFHSDERNIAMGVANITLFSQMDPKFYAYGGLLIYIYKITADIIGLVMSIPHFAQDWAYINVLGRYYSAFFSTMTIIPLFLLGMKLFNKNIAFITIIFYAFTVSSIQTAHFSITENILTLLLITISYTALLYYQKQVFKYIVFLGILLGLAISAKTTGVSYFLIPAVLLITLLIQKKLAVPKLFLSGITLVGFALLIFTITSPFTFLNWSEFIKSMKFENEVVLGINPVVYTLQFTNTIPYLFQIKNLFWQIGPVFIFSLLGVFSVIYLIIKKKSVPLLVIFLFPIFYFLYVGSWHTKFIRYMVPLIPFFLLAAAYFLYNLQKKYKATGSAIISLMVFLSAAWSIAFFSIYTRPQTRIAASEWIYQNIKPGSRILGEHWDEGLPVPRKSGSPENYSISQLTIYEPDTKEKITYYADMLSTADYITITTRRLYGTLLYLPEKYPLTSKYYSLLFSGKLGFTQEAKFSSYPSILGFTINDDASEETFQVYDHPTSFIFKNKKKLSSEEIEKILHSNVDNLD